MSNYVQTDNIATRRDMRNVQLRTNRQQCMMKPTASRPTSTAKRKVYWKPLNTVDKTNLSNKRERFVNCWI